MNERTKNKVSKNTLMSSPHVGSPHVNLRGEVLGRGDEINLSPYDSFIKKRYEILKKRIRNT